MTNDPEPKLPYDPAYEKHQNPNPPIHGFYHLIVRQPMLAGALFGLIIGIGVAGNTSLPTQTGAIAGALAGAVIGLVIQRLWPKN